MSKTTKKYDIAIIGSGLGGLVSGLLLAKRGRSVIILEKNNQLGGNLQTFARDRTIFDSGVHYLGSLAKGQNLASLFQYLEVYESIEKEKMNSDGTDLIYFEGENSYFPLAQGYDNFIEQLLPFFPTERPAIERYISTIKHYCSLFPLYNLEAKLGYDESVMKDSVADVMSEITSNKKLQAVLLGNNFLYALQENTPFYIHALTVNSYIQSAWRCIRGGSQIVKAFSKALRDHGAELFTSQEVNKLNFNDNKLISCETDDYIIEAANFVSNLNPNELFKMFDHENRNKPYVRRVSKLKNGPSVFSTHLVLNDSAIPYFNHNIFHYSSNDHVFSYTNNWTRDLRPNMMMISTSPKEKNQIFTNNISMLTYMDSVIFDYWSSTFHTVRSGQVRGHDYENLKREIAENMIEKLEIHFPTIRSCVKSIHTSSPLTYRDYIGTSDGTMYGIEKSSESPLESMISPKTKVKNLFLTGQNVRLHGILGVTFSAFMCASEIIGDNEYLEKIFADIRDNDHLAD